MGISFIPRDLKSATASSRNNGWLSRSNSQPEKAPEEPSDGFLPGFQPDKGAGALKPTPVATAPAETTLSLDSVEGARQAALNALPAPAAVALRRLWDVVGNARSQEQLLTLLERGTLSASDEKKTVAESLNDLSLKPRAGGIDGEALTRESVALLADPAASTFQGVNTYTCGAANLEYGLTKKPALLARMIEDLTDSDTRMEMNGQVLQMPVGAQEADSSGRNLLNRVLQSTFMNLAGGADRGAYDPSTDTFADGQQGLAMQHVAQTAALFDGEDKTIVRQRTENWKEFRRVLEETPPGETLQVGVEWNKQPHLMLFQGIRDGQAHYFNPQDSGLGSMPKDDFFYKVDFAVFPKRRAEGADFPEELVWQVPQPATP